METDGDTLKLQNFFVICNSILISVSDDTYDQIVNDDKVVLGEEVKIVFTSASSLLDIHIEDCFAHNNKYKTDGEDFKLDSEGKLIEDAGFNHIDLVESDCFLTEKSDEKLKIIQERDCFFMYRENSK